MIIGLKTDLVSWSADKPNCDYSTGAAPVAIGRLLMLIHQDLRSDLLPLLYRNGDVFIQLALMGVAGGRLKMLLSGLLSSLRREKSSSICSS